MKKHYFSHEKAIVESENIGIGTRIWAYAHILPQAQIGADCNICDHVFIENDVIIGKHVTVKCGVQLWDGIRLHDSVFIGPNASFSNDKFPRSKQHPEKYLQTEVYEGASIGAGAVILPGIKIGSGAMVGAGAVVTKNVPPYAVVVGNPAQIVKYVDQHTRNIERLRCIEKDHQVMRALSVTGCKLFNIPSFSDMRGDLTVCELESELPFIPKRCFFVYSVPNNRVRGEHAHINCSQFLITVHGQVNIVLDDAINRQEVLLDRPSLGLLIPPGVWATQYRFSSDSVLCVYASHPYDDKDYIREYDDFLNYKQKRNNFDN